MYAHTHTYRTMCLSNNIDKFVICMEHMSALIVKFVKNINFLFRPKHNYRVIIYFEINLNNDIY